MLRSLVGSEMCIRDSYHAVDWSESWIIALGCFHVCLAMTAGLTRNNLVAQGCIFLTIVGVVGLGETMNSLAGTHWEKFAGQNYFDSHGVFWCTLVALPMLLIAMAMAVNTVVSCGRLLVAVKVKQFKREARTRQKQSSGQSEEPEQSRKKQD
eukprot:TRINITY_DN23498_c0_g1_i1.p2 TRINITY_DN23498_c0_g1~~TRINITY_DN23498_c0_g1_i1.p2  ORF type:complete len:153 (-),score=40.61 TRINITY_DN23498_c0_g1_i1:210-668(-)